MRMNATARRCGVRLFNDFSGKFRSFNPSVNVFVIGAYVKYGEHLGE